MIKVRGPKVFEAIVWCNETLGPIGSEWDYIYISETGRFHFMFIDDANETAFVLRWGDLIA